MLAGEGSCGDAALAEKRGVCIGRGGAGKDRLNSGGIRAKEPEGEEAQFHSFTQLYEWEMLTREAE